MLQGELDLVDLENVVSAARITVRPVKVRMDANRVTIQAGEDDEYPVSVVVELREAR